MAGKEEKEAKERNESRERDDSRDEPLTVVLNSCEEKQQNLQQRISKLEIIFQFLKARKEENEAKERNESRERDESREESSGSNRLG